MNTLAACPLLIWWTGPLRRHKNKIINFYKRFYMAKQILLIVYKNE
jgi:hypothetical protein